MNRRNFFSSILTAVLSSPILTKAFIKSHDMHKIGPGLIDYPVLQRMAQPMCEPVGLVFYMSDRYIKEGKLLPMSLFNETISH